MPTQRHPAYTQRYQINTEDFELVTSTEAARLVMRDPRDPLWQEYDRLRADGKLRPAQLDPCVRFFRGDCIAARDGTPPPSPDLWLERFAIGILVGSILVTAAVITWAVFA